MEWISEIEISKAKKRKRRKKKKKVQQLRSHIGVSCVSVSIELRADTRDAPIHTHPSGPEYYLQKSGPFEHPVPQTAPRSDVAESTEIPFLICNTPRKTQQNSGIIAEKVAFSRLLCNNPRISAQNVGIIANR